MKTKEREDARRMRAEGKSVKGIAKIIGVSPSSVSAWVRDIQLTAEQRLCLIGRDPAQMNVARNKMSESCRQRRRDAQEDGREKARRGDQQHLAGCMLYWAEGAKNRNSVMFTNTDENMIVCFVKFLRECYGVADEEMTLYIDCHTSSDLTVEEIENHWLEVLRLPRLCLRKTRVNHDERTVKKVKHPHGILKLQVNRTDVVQSIFGAIQEYAGFNEEKWLE
jgi:hypothetical protein